MGDRVLKDGVIRGAMVLIISYVSLFAISTVVVTIDTHIAGQDLQLMEVITACAATLGNIGPGLGAVGPMENFEFFPAFSKIWMCFLMIAGRLELMTALVLLAPDYWTD
jgi:trk system potassium uptake protein TrkH